MMPLYPSSVFSVGAVKLGQHLNILSFNLGYGVGFCISSPCPLVIGSQLPLGACLGQCSSLQLRENPQVGPR